MRILAVTNRLPPGDRGGYALGFKTTVEALEARGHAVRTLSSSPPPGAPPAGRRRAVDRLSRDAETSPGWQAAFVKELVNQSLFREACRDFRPDAVLAFDLSGISLSISTLAADLGLPVIYYVAGDWLATWERDIWYRAWPRVDAGFKVLRFLSRRFGLRPVWEPFASGRVVFASRHLEAMARQVGKTWRRGEVLPWGIDTSRFAPRPRPADERPSRVLYVGRLRPEKGADLLIRAVGRATAELEGGGLSLTIAGDPRAHPGYAAYLRNTALSCGLGSRVNFAGFVPPAEMPDLYRAHDVFVCPSASVEPLSLPLLEAMASGLGVVSTATGGNAEFLEDEANALVVPTENEDRLAEALRRLVRDPGLAASLGSRARRTVEESCSLPRTVAALEGIIGEEAGESRRRSPAAATGEIPEPGDAPRRRAEPLDKLASRAAFLAGLGGYLVFARNVLRREKLVKALRRGVRACSAFVSLLLFPAALGPYFRLSGRRRRPAGGPGEKPRSVLVVQLADLGDIVLSGPFLRELRRHLPGAWITLVVQPGLVNIIERCPYVDEIVPYEWRTVRDWPTAFRGAPGWWWSAVKTARRRLWKRRFDLAVSLRWNNDPCQSAALILMYASGAPRRAAYIDRPGDPKLRSPRFVDRFISEGPFRGASKHEVEYQLDILGFLGGRPESADLEAWTDERDEGFARGLLARPGFAGGPLVALAPGARWAYRRWPAERFAEVGRWLQREFGARILIFAGKAERPLADSIAAGLQPDRTLNLAGRTTLRQTAAVLKLCDIFLGIDSGPMHVAAAAGVPTIALFGAGEYGRFRPWGTANEVLRLGLTCYPCSEFCLFSRALCIEGLTVDQAKRVLSRKLAGILK